MYCCRHVHSIRVVLLQYRAVGRLGPRGPRVLWTVDITGADSVTTLNPRTAGRIVREAIWLRLTAQRACAKVSR